MTSTNILPTAGNLYGTMVTALAAYGFTEAVIQAAFATTHSLSGEIYKIQSICLMEGFATVAIETHRSTDEFVENIILYFKVSNNLLEIDFGELGGTNLINIYKNTIPPA